MNSTELIRFIIGAVFITLGLVSYIIEIIGIYKFKYVLNRMHAAAIGDTLGIGLSIIGIVIISGFNYTSLKLVLVMVFLWFTSPVASHLIANLEINVDENPEDHYRKEEK